MKKLELNQMEKVSGGNGPQCAVNVAFNALFGAAVFLFSSGGASLQPCVDLLD